MPTPPSGHHLQSDIIGFLSRLSTFPLRNLKMADEQSINIPQLVIVLVLGGLAIKYLFFTTPVASTARPRGATIRAREQDVEQIQSMFPQVGRRLIMWDLQRNGGNMAVTTERILSGRGLEEVSEARPRDPSALERYSEADML